MRSHKRLNGNGCRSLGEDEWGMLSRSTVRNPRRNGSHSKPRTIQDQPAQLRDCNPLGGITIENATQDENHLIGQGKDGLQEEWILKVCAECGILNGSTFPWITSTGQVDQDNPQAPDIIRDGSIASHGTGILLLTFFGENEYDVQQNKTGKGDGERLPGDM